MAVDGNWNITMSTPMGDRKATLTLKNAGGTLTGTQSADGNSTDIFEGTASGDDVAWKVSITNTMQATLTLKNAGGTLTGTQSADGNSTDIFEGTASGDDVAWKVSITNPMPLTLAFTGKVSGDSISGEMGIGPMGSFPFTGTRA